MDYNKLGSRIRALRIEKGLSQAELARLTGYTHKSAISHIELNKRDITISQIYAFSNAFGITPNELLFGEDGGKDYALKEELSNVSSKELAKGLVALCFRNNTSLEDYHAEQVPIDDERMKELMIECVDNVYYVLNALLSNNTKTQNAMVKLLTHYERPYWKDWEDPELPEWVKFISESVPEDD